MTALRNHKPADFRRLTIEPHRRPRRCHSRHIYGELIPMDGECEPWPLLPKLIVSIGLVGAVWLIVTGGM